MNLIRTVWIPVEKQPTSYKFVTLCIRFYPFVTLYINLLHCILVCGDTV